MVLSPMRVTIAADQRRILRFARGRSSFGERAFELGAELLVVAFRSAARRSSRWRAQMPAFSSESVPRRLAMSGSARRRRRAARSRTEFVRELAHAEAARSARRRIALALLLVDQRVVEHAAELGAAPNRFPPSVASDRCSGFELPGLDSELENRARIAIGECRVAHDFAPPSARGSSLMYSSTRRC